MENFHAQCEKPMIVVCPALESIDAFAAGLQLQQTCDRLGIPVYPSISRAAHALGNFMGYVAASEEKRKESRIAAASHELLCNEVVSPAAKIRGIK